MRKGTTKPASSEAHVQSDSNQKSGKTRKILLIILIVLLIAIIGVLGAFIYSLLKEDADKNVSSNPGRNTVVTLDNKEQILADLDNKVSDGLYEIKMNMEWSFQNASAPSENAYVANVTTNSNTVYFTVTLDKTGETVYESPYIPVGYALKDITLQKELEAGTYPCTLTYHLVDENNDEVSNLAVTVTLNVLN